MDGSMIRTSFSHCLNTGLQPEKSGAGGAYPALVGFICRDTDSTIPISANWMERAVPP